MKIAILTPSRGRSKGLFNFFESVCKTVSPDNQIYFDFEIDNNDPHKSEYYDLLSLALSRKPDNVRLTMFESDQKSVGAIWNDLAKLRRWCDSADWFIMGNDDLIYTTQNWDKILEEKINEKNHPFFCYWFNDGINGVNHCAFPVISKHWVSLLGGFTAEHFRFFFHDTWVFDIAKRAGVAVYIPEVEISHNHFSKDNTLYDETYAQWRVDNTHDIDTHTYKDSERVRQNMSETLFGQIGHYLNEKSKK
jgi:hypothetical protein